MSESPERNSYRVSYPPPERPEITVAALASKVVDCSESGLCFLYTSGTLEEGQVVQGEVRFRRGPTVPIEGTVVRVGAGRAAIQFTKKAVPRWVIFDEQRRLNEHYSLPSARLSDRQAGPAE